MNSFWSLFKPLPAAQRKFTLEELREQYGVLLRNPVVTEANRALVVETIRSIAEFMIWGDQNEPRIFDFFLENNIMTYLQHVLQQPANRSGEVAKQVLQTLSIIIQNVRSETAVFFLFSNNHINNIVDLDFDWEDEEVLGYYVSFLKTISLRLNRGTVQFFIQAGPDRAGFPLYTRAIRLAHNREGMVRAAVRTLTLHVFSVDDPDIQAFVTAPPAAGYFAEVALYLAEQVQLLDRRLSAAEAGGGQALGSLDSQLAEVEDVLSYVSDLLSLGVTSIAQLLASNLWQIVIWPLLLRPLMEPGAAVAAAAPPPSAAVAAGSRHARKSSGGRAGSSSGFTPPGAGGLLGSPGGLRCGGPWGSGNNSPVARHLDAGSSSRQQQQQQQPRIRPVCAVFVLERLFQLLMYQPLLQQLLLALTCGSSTGSCSTNNLGASNSSSGSGSTVSCRSTLLGILAGDQPYPAVMVLRMLVAVLHNRHISPELLLSLSLMTRKRQQQQQSLGGSGSSGTPGHPCPLALLVQVVLSQLQQQQQQQQLQPAGDNSSNPGHAPQQQQQQQRLGPGDLLSLLTQQYLPSQLHALVQRQSETGAAAAAEVAGAAGSGSEAASSKDSSSSMAGLEEWLLHAEQQAGGSTTISRAAAAASSAFSAMGPQLLAALLQLLQLRTLPPMGIWLLGWLLHQLLPVSAALQAPAAADGAGQQGAPVPAAVPAAAAGDAACRPPASSSSSSSSSDDDNDPIDDSSDDAAAGGGTGSASRGSSVSAAAASTSDAADAAPPPPPVSSFATSPSCPSLDQAAAELDPQQQLLLQAVVDATAADMAAQLGSMWCEALLPLVTLEWSGARETMQRPVLRAGSDALLSGTAVWPLLAGLQQQQAAAAAAGAGVAAMGLGPGAAAGGTGVEALSESAKAALSCYLAVQRVVAAHQLQQLLCTGVVSRTPPVPTISEAELKAADVQEGFQVDLAPGSALQCVVSFAPGQERRVFFAVAGLSRKQLAALHGGAGAAAAAASSGASAAAAGSLLCSLPVAVLADPSPSRPQAGIVLSVAPLLGAHPWTDAGVPKWLHVHVRPSVRGLLRVIKTAAAKKGGLLSAMRQLADGHWVLAFNAPDKSAGAVRVVQQHTARLQAAYREALAPLCGLHGLQQQQEQPEAPTAEQPQQEPQQAAALDQHQHEPGTDAQQQEPTSQQHPPQALKCEQEMSGLAQPEPVSAEPSPDVHDAATQGGHDAVAAPAPAAAAADAGDSKAGSGEEGAARASLSSQEALSSQQSPVQSLLADSAQSQHAGGGDGDGQQAPAEMAASDAPAAAGLAGGQTDGVAARDA